ncbi:unnamed protein product [Urochloa decumbens]|uniref:SBP-type domain-containing protein n=1 Tax=Urochloa decumbens TaxID=240449 RepID=A0ABC9AV87_9POAL
MDCAAVSGVPSWGAAVAADPGSIMLSSDATEVWLQDFATSVVQPAQQEEVAGAGRRSRTDGGGGAAACSVDGCLSDLTHCREYYRRHKVCEMHSKMPVVFVRSLEQRFCQQCSRFHILSEFDKGKRSCRKRLADHNRRRRKPKPDLTNLGGFIAYHQVNQFEVYPRGIATVRQNSDAIHFVNHSPPFSTSLLGPLRVPKQFLFALDSGGMLRTDCPGHLLSGTLRPKCASSLLSSSMHRPSPALIPTAGQAQVASPVSCITSTLQSTTTAANTSFSSGGGHLAFASDAVLSSQELRFPWQY